jgi:carboxylesterase
MDEVRVKSKWRRWWIAIAAVVGLLALATAGLMRVSARAVPATPARPVGSYDEAVSRVRRLQALDGEQVWKPTIFLDQGSRVETAVVIFHGFTNNPEQFERLGRAYEDAGYNVLIPRLPYHGERNLMTKDLSKITAAELADYSNEAIDIASGLGETVEVVGLSGGGNLAARAAHDRDEVKRAAIISPLFGVDLLPAAVTKPIVAWSRVLPDVYLWWDPAKREAHVPVDAYPRYSLKSISAFFEVGYDFMRREPTRRTRLERVVVVTNAADDSVDEELATSSITDELKPEADDFVTYEYPRRLGYAHDLVDPEGVNSAKIDAIYGELLPLLGLSEQQ